MLKNKKLSNPNPLTGVQIRKFLAEKEGFEPSLRLSHTTPLAGEPLRPLGYFSLPISIKLTIKSRLRLS